MLTLAVMLHTAPQVFLGIGQFVVVVLASVVIGFVVGMIAAFITRFSEHVHGECPLQPSTPVVSHVKLALLDLFLQYWSLLLFSLWDTSHTFWLICLNSLALLGKSVMLFTDTEFDPECGWAIA